ncbi:ubiquitin carboxyl-terminal hydrolase 37-like isoform X2 [Scophthalmus maximus]|uniref:ubiquitin carboxyl-terminal hydrolase 37-like isoform X2 n=1 Tax=Scophthalmus maximus TaxID=52904 RepID=UPI001FA8A281|nr:ubiquitin carboxyl-terminal hydrolase 37-like isoform X2 [Scophthalmus maximus]
MKMFHCFSCNGKKSTNVVDVVVSKRRSAYQHINRSRQSVSAAPAATSKQEERTSRLCVIFRWPSKRESHPQQERQRVGTSGGKAHETSRCKKPHWCFKGTCRVTPVSEKTPTPCQDQKREEDTKKEEAPPRKSPPITWVSPNRFRVSLVPEERSPEEKVPPRNNRRYLNCCGFPNPVQNCYINSCLQSLLTLEDFVTDIRRQEHVWSAIPEATLMKSFMDIAASHFSKDYFHKISLLVAFKRAVSTWNPLFGDHCQKDAHEFLISVLAQMRSLVPRLQERAAAMGGAYVCPVESHLVFRMRNTRTCKSCGAGSAVEEQFTNLSLDLLPGSGVAQMLEDYQAGSDLEYRCSCGTNTSRRCSSFVSLPRVLVLHLKRFSFAQYLELKKVHDPVALPGELVVPSSQGLGGFRLVSIISHMGTTAISGHYVCDGVDPGLGQVDPTDCWLTYNDAMVTKRSGATLCRDRQTTAYILFYQRRKSAPPENPPAGS